MVTSTQFAEPMQVPASDVEILTLADMLPDDFDHPAADDAWIESPFWESRELRFDERMARNAIILKWRCGTIDSVIAIMALIAHEAMDFDLVMQMISDHEMVSKKMEAA